jgi:FMN phosphatase YigB (HAD superfamily)
MLTMHRWSCKRRGERPALDALITRSGPENVIGLDVFDTVVVRTSPVRSGVFDAIVRTMALAGIELPKDFRRLRLQAEDESRRASPGREVTLSAIYAAMARLSENTKNIGLILASVEEQLEIEVGRPVAETVALIHRLRAAGRRVVLISDMYLSAEVIGSLLTKIGVPLEGIPLYVSSSVGTTKRSGQLFLHVCERERIRPADLIHIGDNWNSDFLTPRRLGIRSFRYDRCDLTRFERLFAESSSAAGANLAGAMRVARVAHAEPNSPAGLRYTAGTNVAAPVLLIFLAWVLQQAHASGVRRLYFLARDGQFLIELAREMSRRLGLDLELRYLYGSRQAWFLPAVKEVEPAHLEWLLGPDPRLTAETIAQRGGLDVALVQSEISKLLGRHVSSDFNLSAVDHARITAEFTHTRLPLAISAAASKARGPLINYLRQEGLFDGTRWALVDVGWLGRLQDALRTILKYEGMNDPLRGYYFGLQRNTSDPLNDKAAFFGAGGEPMPDWRFSYLVEIFTAADHGSTVGYEQAPDGSWRPTLRLPGNPTATNWGLADLRAGARTVLEMIHHDEFADLAKNAVELRQVLVALVGNLMRRPTWSDAAAFGDFPFACDQNEQYVQSLAPPLRPWKALRYATSVDWRILCEITLWVEASRARSGPIVRALLSPLACRVGRSWQKLYGRRSRKDRPA